MGMLFSSESERLVPGNPTSENVTICDAAVGDTSNRTCPSPIVAKLAAVALPALSISLALISVAVLPGPMMSGPNREFAPKM